MRSRPRLLILTVLLVASMSQIRAAAAGSADQYTSDFCETYLVDGTEETFCFQATGVFVVTESANGNRLLSNQGRSCYQVLRGETLIQEYCERFSYTEVVQPQDGGVSQVRHEVGHGFNTVNNETCTFNLVYTLANGEVRHEFDLDRVECSAT